MPIARNKHVALFDVSHLANGGAKHSEQKAADPN